ncbi:MAG: hypothetical protein V4760_17080 [Bdellovibrionota bacterium]
MALEDIRDSVKEQFSAVFARVRESSAFIELSEKYQSLSPTAQKGALAGGGLLAFLILMLVPWMYFSSSSDQLTQYEDKRSLVQTVYQVSREASSVGLRNSAPIAASDFQSKAQGIVTESALQPEQMQYVSPIPAATVPGIAKSIDQAGVEVSLKKLNLSQVIDIGYKLQSMDSRGRLLGLDIKASTTDRHYYDVIYRVIGFGPKPDTGTAGTAGRKARGK